MNKTKKLKKYIALGMSTLCLAMAPVGQVQAAESVTVSAMDSTTYEETGVAGFISRLYSVCLGRTPDAGGKADWVTKLTNKEISGASAAAGFFASNEFVAKGISDADFVEYLYQAFMNRASDPSGKADWITVLGQGMSRMDVCEQFAASNEFAAICKGYGIAATDMELPNGGIRSFVTRLYRVCLDREADENGMNDWVNQLASKRISGRQTARGFVFSNEFIAHNYSNSEYVEHLYRAFMGRRSDENGKKYWLSQMSMGASREDVFNGFADSTEFGNICTKYGICRDLSDQYTPNPAEKTHINVTRCTFNLATPDSNQVKKVENAINAYIGDKINVEISLTDIGSDEYTEKAYLSLNAGEINLLWTASWEGTIGTNDLVPQNSVYDITDLLPGTDLYNSMAASQWEATKYNGKNYFIPVYKDNVEGYDFMFRGALVDKYGWDLSSVKSLSDLTPILADCKAEGLKYPFLTQKTAMFNRFYIDKFDFFTGSADSNWVAVDRATNSVVNTIQTPEYLAFCTLMAQWAEAGYIHYDDATKNTSYSTTQTPKWGVSWWTDIPVNEEANDRYDQEVVMVPATQRWAHSTSALGSCYCVTANSSAAEAQACIDFMGLLYTDSKLADMYTFGIEGEDFSYKANGQVVKVSEKYNHSMWESASATIVTPEAGEPANRAGLYNVFNSVSQLSCAAGFRFDKTPVATQYNACQIVFEQYGFILENGGFPSKQVASFIASYQKQLDAAGYQKVLKEFQKQYNEWLAIK